MMGARIMSNTLNKVSSNSEDTKPFFIDYKKPYISNIYLLFLTKPINKSICKKITEPKNTVSSKETDKKGTVFTNQMLSHNLINKQRRE